MDIGFIDEGGWALPVGGTLGNKSRNLLENRVRILSQGLKIPRSVSVPFEYIQAAELKEQFVLEQTDRYFPNWLSIFVRSDAPDEDSNRRFPGLYESEHIWHRDRKPALCFISNVLGSYNNRPAQIRRGQYGMAEMGMGVLLQEPVTNTPGDFDASHTGAFSDIGEFALLNFTNPEEGLSAMKRPSLRKYWVDEKGIIQADAATFERDLAYKLRKLVNDLPKNDGKGWEIEFAVNREGTYIVQTTPVAKSGKVNIPYNIKNLFQSIAVVGTNSVVTNGILFAPHHEQFQLEDFVRFDVMHKNYCLVTVPENITLSGTARLRLLDYALNPKVIIIDTGEVLYNPLAAHVEQYMREGRIAMRGHFTDTPLSGAHVFGSDFLRSGRYCGLLYSPTKLIVIADEVSGNAVVGLSDTRIHEFRPVVKTH